MSAPLDIDHPWPGPESFRTQDAPFFRGRDHEIKQLLQLVRRERSVVLYGASGLGKTSLVNAGVVPRLGADEYFAVPIRISYVAGAPSISEQLQTEIFKSRSGAGMPAPRPLRTAWELLHLRDEPIEGAQPLLIFDQFEELFTLGAGTPQAAELIEELQALIEGVPPTRVRERLERSPEEARSLSFHRRSHRVLLGIREDFLYGLESLRSQIPSIIHNRYRIGPLSGAMALDVVLQPPRTDHVGPERTRPPLVERDVAELIVRTVASSVIDDRALDLLEVEPALLSILCMELARRRLPATPITRELVIGSRTDIISSFYERALGDAPDAVRAYIEDELVTATGFRTSTVVVEALAVSGFTSDLLADLVNKRLLRVIDRQKGTWVELTHDVLTEIAARSRSMRRDRLREQQERNARVENERLEQLARAERERMDRLELRARETRRRANRLLVLTGLLVALGVVAGLAWNEASSHKAEAERRDAATQRYQAELRLRRAADDAKRALRRQFIDASLREQRYREALAHLAAVVREEPDASWARALLGDLLLRRDWPLPLAPLFPEGGFTYLSCNQSGTRCAAAYRDGRILVRGDITRDLTTGVRGLCSVFVSIDGKRLVAVPETPGVAIQWTLDGADTRELRFPVHDTWDDWAGSSDGQTVVLPTGTDLTIWHLGEGGMYSSTVHRDLTDSPFELSANGKWLTYVKPGNRIGLANSQGQELREFHARGHTTRLQIDSHSNVLFAAVGDGTVHRWSVPQGAELAPLKASRPITRIVLDWSGTQVALALEGGGLELWKPPWRVPQTLMRSSNGVFGVSFAPDNQWLIASMRDGALRAWSAAGAPRGEPMHLDGLALVAAQQGGGLVSVALGGASARWLIREPHVPRVLTFGQPIRDAWFVSDDAFVALGESRWFEQHGDVQKIVPIPWAFPYISRDRQYVATATATALYLRTGIPAQQTEGAGTLLLPTRVDFAMFSADSKRMVTVGGGKAYLFDVVGQRLLGEPIDGVGDAWLNRDGTVLAMKMHDLRLTLWRSAGDGSLTKLADVDPDVNVSLVAFDHAGDVIAFVVENQVRLWSPRDRRFVGRPALHDGLISDVEFSADDRWLATASQDKRARIWEVTSGLPASDWFDHDSSARIATFSPAGRQLLTVSSRGNLRIWGLAGTADASDMERRLLARAAEVLSGRQIDPDTAEEIPVPRPFDALEALRGEIERACPATTCTSATLGLIRAVLLL